MRPPLPPPAIDNQKAVGGGLETAVLAAVASGACRACINTKGVKQVVSGYSGDKERAHYEQVGTGQPVTPNRCRSPSITRDLYGEILRIYFSIARPDPAQSPGADYGSQYRSAIFCTTRRSGGSHRPTSRSSSGRVLAIVTRIDPLKAFYPAEPITCSSRTPYILVNFCRIV